MEFVRKKMSFEQNLCRMFAVCFSDLYKLTLVRLWFEPLFAGTTDTSVVNIFNRGLIANVNEF
jgi:hypothetical protein